MILVPTKYIFVEKNIYLDTLSRGIVKEEYLVIILG